MKFSFIIFALFLAPAISRADLVAHWPLDEESGRNAAEVVGNRIGTLRNFPANSSQWQEGKIGGALRFDGMDDFVEHHFDLPRERGTLMHWVWPDTDETGVIYYESDYPEEDADYNGFNSGGPVLEIHTFTDGRYGFYYQDGHQENMASRDYINPNGWNHVAVTWDVNNDMVLYINCEEVDRDDLSNEHFDNDPAKEHYFGRAVHDPETRSFDGLLDDVRVYDHAMEAEEIAGYCDLNAGRHSAVAADDGLMKDETLVGNICSELLAVGGPDRVKNITLIVDSPFGAGFFDDMEETFGENGACAGVPWVAAASSGADEVSRGWPDDIVMQFSGNRLGSSWSQALAGDGLGNVSNLAGRLFGGSVGNYVLNDLAAVAARDIAGPEGLKLASPAVAYGNGGDAIEWHSNQSRHEAILFGGMQTHLRHGNNLENVEEALFRTWQGEDTIITVLAGASSDNFNNALAAAGARTDSNTQWLFYFSDHGGTILDFEGAFGPLDDFEIVEGTRWDFRLHDGWLKGLAGNRLGDSGDTIAPMLRMDVGSCQSCTSLNFYLNGNPLDIPPAVETGILELPLSVEYLLPGRNRFEVRSPSAEDIVQSSGDPGQKISNGALKLSALELSTGPINSLMLEHRLVPGQSAAYFDQDRNGEGIFVEILENQKAVVYVFSYDAEDPVQSWMIGVGDLSGDGIVISEMFRPTGGRFGPQFNPDDVTMREFGSLVFRPPACGDLQDRGDLWIRPSDGDWVELKSENYVQLSRISDCDGSGGSANKGYSGSWFDPAHNGEGIILEVLEDGRGLAQWFTYDRDGRQMWLQGAGVFEGATLTIDSLISTSGTRWGDYFDSDSVAATEWGSLTMNFTGCDSAQLSYESTAEFGSGTLEMQRLTRLMGISCSE